MAAHPNASTGPLGWTALDAPGVWTKELVTATPSGGDAVTLVRIAPGAAAVPDVTDDDRLLVVHGSVELDGEPIRHHPGDYLAPTAPSPTVRAPGPAAVLLRLTGPALGDPVRDGLGPDGWFRAGPGIWAKPFVPLPEDLSTFDERIAGLTWFEPGATSDRHPHPTSHRFLFLAGVARDEMILPDGRREVAERRPGDFVDYPVGIEHRTHSSDGCLLFFVHEAVAPGPVSEQT